MTQDFEVLPVGTAAFIAKLISSMAQPETVPFVDGLTKAKMAYKQAQELGIPLPPNFDQTF